MASTSVKNGSYEDASVWNGGHVPYDNEDVTVAAGHVVTSSNTTRVRNMGNTNTHIYGSLVAPFTFQGGSVYIYNGGRLAGGATGPTISGSWCAVYGGGVLSALHLNLVSGARVKLMDGGIVEDIAWATVSADSSIQFNAFGLTALQRTTTLSLPWTCKLLDPWSSHSVTADGTLGGLWLKTNNAAGDTIDTPVLPAIQVLRNKIVDPTITASIQSMGMAHYEIDVTFANNGWSAGDLVHLAAIYTVPGERTYMKDAIFLLEAPPSGVLRLSS